MIQNKKKFFNSDFANFSTLDDQDYFFSHYNYKLGVSQKKHKLEEIQKYLFDKENFFFYEFTLFNNFLHEFNPEYVNYLIPTVNKYIDLIKLIDDYQHEILTFYINISFFYLKKEMDIEATKYFTKIEESTNLALKQVTLFQYARINFVKGFIYKSGLDLAYKEAQKFGFKNLISDMNRLKEIRFHSAEF